MGKTLYVCPMHSEVRQDHPGHCPKCGMSLELVKAAAGYDAKLIDLTRRFWIGVAWAAPVFIVALALLIPIWAGQVWSDRDASQWIPFGLTFPIAGWPLFKSSPRPIATKPFAPERK